MAFGRPIGVTINYAAGSCGSIRPERATLSKELLFEAVLCGRAGGLNPAWQKRHVSADRESSWIAVDITTTN